MSNIIKVFQSGNKAGYILDPSKETINYLNKQRMKSYIGVKMIMAIAMTRGVATSRGFTEDSITSISDEESLKEGYVCDNGKSICWKPKEEFEASYYPIEDKTKITRNDVEGFIVQGEPIKFGEKTTIVLDTTLTGFDTLASAACVDPANFNLKIGADIARKDITDKIWGHLGFVLQWAKNGLNAKVTNIDHLFEGYGIFKEYRRKGNSEMRPYIDGEDLTGISISDEDKKLNTLVGGMIARNPKNYNDEWYVAKKYFEDNLELANTIN